MHFAQRLINGCNRYRARGFIQSLHGDFYANLRHTLHAMNNALCEDLLTEGVLFVAFILLFVVLPEQPGKQIFRRSFRLVHRSQSVPPLFLPFP